MQLEMANLGGDTLRSWANLIELQNRRRLSRSVGLSPAWVRTTVPQVVPYPSKAVLVAADGELRAAGLASLELNRSEGTAYFEAVTGRVSALAVANDDDIDLVALETLIKSLVKAWTTMGATGAKIYWPIRDGAVGKIFARHGLYIDAYVGRRSTTQVAEASPPTNVILRPARLADVEAAADISLQVVDAHIPSSPFARRVPGLEEAFQERFMAYLAEPDPGSRPFFLAAEAANSVVGLAECRIGHPGCQCGLPVGYIDSLGVVQASRSRGVGAALAEYAHKSLRDRGASEVHLLVSHYNVGARMFWRRLGYTSALCLFQSHWLTDTNVPPNASDEFDERL